MTFDKEARHVLLCTAHCDDAELWAGGTIARWADHGVRTVVGIAGHTPERQRETHEAATVLGFMPVFKEDERGCCEWILELLAACTPDVLITHPPYDPHPEHQEVCREVMRALTRHRHRQRYPARWYHFETYYLTRSPTAWSMLVDITDTWERKAAALGKHRSQSPPDLLRMARHACAVQGMRARCDYAESFHPFDLLGRWPRLRDLP